MVTEEIAPIDPRVEPGSPLAGGALAARLCRFRTRLDALEATARAANPRSIQRFGWATFSMDTGLTERQEDFITCWSPRAIIKQCQAQRVLIDFLTAWVTEQPDDSVEVARVIALIGTLDDALPD